MPEELRHTPGDTSQGTASRSGDSYGMSEMGSLRILTALEENRYDKVKRYLSKHHVADIADLIDMVSPEQRKELVHILREDFPPDVLVELDSGVREEIINLLGAAESAGVIGNLETDDALEIIQDLEEEDQQQILAALPKENRQELQEGLAYPEHSAGRLVERRSVTVPKYWTVGQTIDYLRSSDDLPKDFHQIFVVDPKFHPVGGVKLSHVMRSKRDTKIVDVMFSDLRVIDAEMDQEEVAYLFKQYGLSSAPVVNKEGRMLGIISVEDVIDVIEEEAQEDIMHLGGVGELDLHSTALETLRSRFPWLLVNLLTAVLASAVIALFEGAIAKLAALAVLMPMAASMGGNAGTQTLTVTVRALATKELTTTNAMRVLIKEAVVGSLNGVVFAAMVALCSYFWMGNLELSLIFGGAMIFTLMMAGLFGALIPLWLTRLGVDPAVASSVFLTTVTDVVAFGAFLGMATLLL